MTPEQTDLVRRLVADPRWRWMPGMLAWRTTHRGERVQVRLIDGLDQHAELADPRRVETTPSGTRLFESGHSVVDGWHRVEDLTPDLTDPATVGCLLSMLGRPSTLPAPWVVDWHAGMPPGEAVARLLLVAWKAEVLS